MQRGAKGFTIVELMVTLAIAAIILALGTPSFLNLMEKNRVRSTSQQLVELLRLSRLTAVEHRKVVSVCGSSDSANCDNDWTSSIISVKRGENGDADEIMASMNITDKVAVSKTNSNPTNPNIDFRVSGWIPWDQTTFTICPVDGDLANAYQIVISGSGKIKVKPNKDEESWC